MAIRKAGTPSLIIAGAADCLPIADLAAPRCRHFKVDVILKTHPHRPRRRFNAYLLHQYIVRTPSRAGPPTQLAKPSHLHG